MWAPRTGHEHCAKCRRTDRRHAGGGLCKVCYKTWSRSRVNRGKRWSVWHGLTACMECGSNERPHHARGLCTACYCRDLYHSDSSKRREYNKRWNMKNAEISLKRSRAWATANRERVREISRNCRLRTGAIKFAEGAVCFVLYAGFWCKGTVTRWVNQNRREVRLRGGTVISIGARMLKTERPKEVVST